MCLRSQPTKPRQPFYGWPCDKRKRCAQVSLIALVMKPTHYKTQSRFSFITTDYEATWKWPKRLNQWSHVDASQSICFFQFTRQAKSSLGKTLLDSGCIPSVKSGTNRQTLTQNMKYMRAGNQTLMLELEPMSMFGSSLPSLVCGLTSSQKSYLQLMFAYICKYLTNKFYIYLQLHFALRYVAHVGVIWFVFHVIQLLINIYTTKICCTRISAMKHQQKSDSKSDLPKLKMDIWSACLLILYLNT